MWRQQSTEAHRTSGWPVVENFTTPRLAGKAAGFLDGLMALGSVEGKDADLLGACKHQQPINQNCTSQLQRANKAKKKEAEGDEAQPQNNKATSKAKAKPKTKAKAKTLPKAKAKAEQGAKETAIASKDAASETREEHSEQQDVAPKKTPEKTQKAKKKGMMSEAKGTKKTKLKKKKKKTKRENKDNGQKEEEPEMLEELPAGLDPKASRAINRKRFTSRAWHKEYVSSKAEGLDSEQAKVRARIASQAASVEFAQLWPSTSTVFDLR